MTLALHGGPHSHCHFQWDEEVPPKEIRLRGPNPGTTAVYYLSGYAEGYWRYAESEITWDTPPRLVNFITHKQP